MGNYTREEVLQMAEDEDVEFIRLQFTDMFGTLKNIAITARELPRALNHQYVVDGSFIAGIAGEKEPDMYLYPDLDTFTILPWRPQQGKVARLLCDIYRPDGTPHDRSARYLLNKTAEKAEAEGYTCYIDPECEFFLFHTDDNGVPTTVTHEKAGYLDISPVDLGENARRDMVLNLEEMGFEVESSHHETAPAQHEIDFKSTEMRKTADCIMTFKMAVRTIAKRHGLHATFMPKPRAEVNGSGMHIRFSLFKNGRNIFVNPDNPGELSEEAYYFVGGLLAHSREMALITNPLVNSYKRLVPGYEAPTELTWTTNNQNSLVRIPGARGAATGIELRSPDAASNPYLVFAVCLEAGLDGIKRKIYPTKSSNRSLSESDQKAMNIENLPENLKDAIACFEESDWVKEVLGKDFCEEYVLAKKKEWLKYTRQVTDWEINEYLYRI
ncbi:MAG: type I glutamate--ammonia ligase [Blautia sp.]|nr:type I glutamate--ammonia ligase [Blautia sp.]MDD7729553.1 type I glutamate--ammonia ligase [Clostridia bacterium]MDY5665418.1 type I glutamate--ammonia ligase [Blautia sp.]